MAQTSPIKPSPLHEKIIKFISKLWLCHIWGWHLWTSPLQEREGKPDEEKLFQEKIQTEGFEKVLLDETMMYCKRCGHVSEVAINFRNKLEKSFLSKKEDPKLSSNGL